MLHKSRTTIPTRIQDHPEWHRGRTDYCLWLIGLENEELHRKVEAAREHLSEFLLKPYRRQPHITLFVCGFFVDTPQFDDDYSAQQLELQERSLKEAGIKPFSIEIGGLNSFTSAPFLEVHDRDGGIERVRAALSATGREVGRSAFTPHVTIGLYSGAYGSDSIAPRIADVPKDPCTLFVDRITFALYQAQDIAGALTYQHDVSLRTG
jgi:2'-5' RNA ligase